jgi:hypothetical protein
MKTLRRTIAILELLLIFPAVLFMTALFVRNLQPQQYEPARSAQRIVDWFSARTGLGLYVCLMMLPLIALVIGVASVVRTWRRDAEFREASLRILATVRTHVASLLIAAVTVIAGGILGIVALHVITD